VTFKVKGEVFHAHKLVLAIRSPVFMAELYGPMGDKRRTSINVEDMEPNVFRA
jgi:speckle-type POZ protein